MCDTAVNIGLIVIGAIAAFGFGLLSFWLQRLWVARDAFHLVVEEQIAKLEIITKDESKPIETSKVEDAFVKESIPVLIAASRRVKRHIGDEAWRHLDAALEDYRDYQAKYRGIEGRCKIDLEHKPGFSESVHAKLEKIDECVTDNPVA